MTVPVDPSNAQPSALETLLRWYVAMGADAILCEVPQNRFAQPEPVRQGDPRLVRPAPPLPVSLPGPGEGLGTPDALIAQAKALAAECATLDDLKAHWASLPGCGLSSTAAHMIFSGGTPGARVMWIGGAPDSDDERHGEAFTGAKGRLLDAMLKAIGLDRREAYLANVIPWRPPGNRPPTALELGLCLPFARRHIALAAPDILICLGERAAQPLLGSRDPISRLRGRWLAFEGEATTVKTLVTFPPDYLLKQPLQKRRAWADLLMIAAEL